MKRFERGKKGICPGFEVLCLVAALMASIFTTGAASADAPAKAIKGTPLVVPAAVLGLSNPYLIRASLPAPSAKKFLLSEDIRTLAKRVDVLAREGLYLNPNATGPELLHLRVESRLSGGVVTLCIRH